MPRNAHPDSTFSSHLHNDWTLLQTKDEEENNNDEDNNEEVESDDDQEEEENDDDEEESEEPESEENVQLEKFEHYVPNFDGADANKGYDREVPE